MANETIEILRQRAKEAGYESVDDYLVYCEVFGLVKKMNVALDRALLPDQLTKYCGLVDESVFPREKK